MSTKLAFAPGDYASFHGKVHLIESVQHRPDGTVTTYVRNCAGETLHTAEPELLRKLEPAALLPWQVELPKQLICGLTGSDPEIFVRADATGAVIPSFQFLPEKSPNTLAYTDGFQAEISPEPASSHEALASNVRRCLLSLSEAAKRVGGHLAICDVAEIPVETLRSSPPQHVEFGCSPSLNAYGPSVYAPVMFPDSAAHPERYSGCHLHFSHTADFPAGAWFPTGTVVMLDKVLGVVLTALGRDLEDPRRRIAYGRPGEYRLPGERRLEYRTPGAFLLAHPVLFSLAADIGRWAFKAGLAHNGWGFPLPASAHEIIQRCDADAARLYLRSQQAFFKQLFGRLWGTEHAEAAFELVRAGAKASGLAAASPEDSWKLRGGWTGADASVKSFLEGA